MFAAPLVRYGARTLSLDQLEHDIIGARTRDPLVSIALSRATRSEPALLPRAYRGQDLRETLAAAWRAFLRDPRRNRIDARARTMRLARVFRRHASDFGGAAAMPAFVARQLGLAASGWSVTFLADDEALDAGAPGAATAH